MKPRVVWVALIMAWGAVVLNVAATAPVAANGLPVLGREWAPYQRGYGEVMPSEINNGGDPTGIVRDITWDSWGGTQAIGHGTSTYVAPGKGVADGTQERAEVIAFELGTCDGKSAYRAIEWYFPHHGESFDPDTFIDPCTGEYVYDGDRR